MKRIPEVETKPLLARLILARTLMWAEAKLEGTVQRPVLAVENMSPPSSTKNLFLSLSLFRLALLLRIIRRLSMSMMIPLRHIILGLVRENEKRKIRERMD